jgi:hypothetical protein
MHPGEVQVATRVQEHFNCLPLLQLLLLLQQHHIHAAAVGFAT